MPSGAYIVYNTVQTLGFDVVLNEVWERPTEVTEHPVEAGPNVTDNVRVMTATCTLTVFVTNEPTENSPQFGTGVTAPNPPTLLSGFGPNDVGPLPHPTVAKQWFNLNSIIGLGPIGALAATEIDQPIAPVTGLPVNTGQMFAPTTLTFPLAFDAVQQTIAVLETLRTTVALVKVIGSKDTCAQMVVQSFTQNRSSETGTGAEFTIVLKEIRLVTVLLVPAPSPTQLRASAPVNRGTQNTATPPATTQSLFHQALAAIYSTMSTPAPSGT